MLERLLNLVYELSELQNSIKTSSQKLIIFQAGIIKLCNKQTGNNNEDLERRIAELENKLRNGVVQNTNNVRNNKNVGADLVSARASTRLAPTKYTNKQ